VYQVVEVELHSYDSYDPFVAFAFDEVDSSFVVAVRMVVVASLNLDLYNVLVDTYFELALERQVFEIAWDHNNLFVVDFAFSLAFGLVV
jgi:hypothetical protein